MQAVTDSYNVVGGLFFRFMLHYVLVVDVVHSVVPLCLCYKKHDLRPRLAVMEVEMYVRTVKFKSMFTPKYRTGGVCSTDSGDDA